MRPLLARISAAVVSLCFTAQIARGIESRQVITERMRASVITDTDIVQVGQVFRAALYLRLSPGWHTYWVNPGDAGVPVQVTTQLLPDSYAGPIEWPSPERIAEGDLTTFAYRGDVVLPFNVTAGGTPLTLKVHAEWLVCRDICVPEQGDFTLALPNGPAAPSTQSALIAAATIQIPQPAPFTATLAPDGMLSLRGPDLPANVTQAEFFPSTEGEVETAGRQAPVREDGGLSIRLALGRSHPSSTPLNGVIRLTAGDGASQAFAIAAQPGPASSTEAFGSLPLLLFTAFAGGLLLNLMPCVFPVLAMKALALARFSASDRRVVRIEAGSYTLGVVASFVALGSILVGLRGAGQAVGWGFQFQSPFFVTAVTWLLFATGLNLAGVFSFGERFAGTGQALASKPGHLGSFFTGLLAVVVATPCTAAFMGAALAGALAAPPVVAILVFATMGLGLALPYVALALAPRLASALPRPGRWMETVRQALAFPMFGAAAWLVWVVSQQAGPAGVLTAGVGLVTVGFAAWGLGVAQASSGRGRYAGYLAVVAGAAASVVLLTVSTGAGSDPSEPYSPARLAELRGQGRAVFVNMTASWCLSCLLNERLALSPGAVRSAFASANVAYLKGDWTRQDATISAFLRDHDRDGVPLYVFYAPGQSPVILPQILSEATVLAQIRRLGG